MIPERFRTPLPRREKPCAVCGTTIVVRIGAHDEFRKTTCSKKCRSLKAAHANRDTYHGPNSWRWKGGLHSHSYRKIAFRAYPKKCDHCGTEEQLMVHHRNEDRSDNRVENLQVLCRSCHGKHHGIYS